MFYLIRSIHICLIRQRDIHTNISSDSIKEAIDKLRTGLLLYNVDGDILLSNRQMDIIAKQMTGNPLQNAKRFQQIIEDDILFFTAQYENETFALEPLCTEEKLFTAMDKLRDYFKNLGLPLVLSGLEENVVERLKSYPGGTFEFETNRDEYDYVYNAADLIKLSGRKFHSKKNHLNSFRKNYPEAEYLPINNDIITLCKITINGWYKKRLTLTPDDPFIKAERDAIIEVLNNFDELKLKGGAIFMVNKVMAFTFGEALNSDTAVIHVEKADPDVNGAYTAINQAFVEHEWADMTYINREEDM